MRILFPLLALCTASTLCADATPAEIDTQGGPRIGFRFDFGSGESALSLDIGESSPGKRLHTPQCLVRGMTASQRHTITDGPNHALTVSNPYYELRAHAVDSKSDTQFVWTMEFFVKENGALREQPAQTYSGTTRYEREVSDGQLIFKDFTIEGDGQFGKLKRRFEWITEFEVGKTAKAEAVLSNGYPIKEIVVLDGGTGYAEGSEITFQDTWGQFAMGTLSVNPATGAVTAVNLTNHGSNYYDISGHSISRSTQADRRPTPEQKKELEAYERTRRRIISEARAKGESPAKALAKLEQPEFLKTQNSISTPVTQRSVKFEAVLDLEHESPPLEAKRGVTNVTVVRPGEGYARNATVEFKGECVKPAQGRLFIGQGRGYIQGMHISVKGSGYISPPEVVINDPDGKGHSAVLQAHLEETRAKLMIKITDPGTNYRRAPGVRLFADGKPVGGVSFHVQLENDETLASISAKNIPASLSSNAVLRLEIEPPALRVQGPITKALVVYDKDGETILSREGSTLARSIADNTVSCTDFTQGPGGKMMSKETTLYKNHPFGRQELQKIIHCYLPDGTEDVAAREVTEHFYYDKESDGKAYGKLKAKRKSGNGPWVYYIYGKDVYHGKTIYQYLSSSWDGNGIPGEAGNGVRETERDTFEDYALGGRRGKAIVDTSTTKLDGKIVEKHLSVFWKDLRTYPVDGLPREAGEWWEVDMRSADDPAPLITKYEAFRDFGINQGKERLIVYPDGTAFLGAYDKRVTTISRGILNDERTDIVEGEISVTTTNDLGKIVSEKKFYRSKGNTVEQTEFELLKSDEFGRPLLVRHKGDPTNTVSYTYGPYGMNSRTDRNGTIRYTRDAMRRVSEEQIGEAKTSYERDALNRVTRTSVNDVVMSETQYDSMDRVRAESNRFQNELMKRSYHYFKKPFYNATWTSFFNSDKIASVEEFYKDGSPLRIYGLGVAGGAGYAYEVAEDGKRTTVVTLLNPDGSPTEETVRQTQDWTGRAVSIQTPSPAGSGVSEESIFYDASGRPARVSRTGRPDILYAYDKMGRLSKKAVDLNGNGRIDEGDEVETFEVSFVRDPFGGANRRTLFTRTRPDGSVETAQMTASLDGNRTQVSDAGGKVSVTTAAKDGSVETVTRLDDGTSLVATMRDGLLRREVVKNAGGEIIRDTSWTYDAFRRPAEETELKDGRTQTTRMTYYNDGSPRSVSRQDQPTVFIARTPVSEEGSTLALVTEDGRARLYSYNPRGQLVREEGNALYPSEYTRDAAGRPLSVKTRRAPDGEPDTTRWTYNTAGLPTVQTNPDGGSVRYAYDTAGRLVSRTWARGVTTTYAYDKAGLLESVRYSDGTPPVVFTRDKRGLPLEVADASGKRALRHDALGRIVQERHTEGPLAGTAVEYACDERGRAGRTALTLPAPFVVERAYDNETGNLARVGWGDGKNEHAYAAYERADSGELRGVKRAVTGTQTTLSTRISHAGNGRLSDVYHYPMSGTQDGGFHYTYDNTGLCVTAGMPGWSKWTYAYNARRELTQADLTPNEKSTDKPQGFAYLYDDSGNRVETHAGETQTRYATLPGNAYASTESKNPRHTQTFVYDADGNLLDDGRWVYAWDAENRLASAQEHSEGAARKLTFAYDTANRRVQKTLWKRVGPKAPWERVYARNFLYDGDRLAAELDGMDNNRTVRTYAWGESVPLGISDAAGKTHFTLYDGCGNVVGLYPGAKAKGSLQICSPFGEIISSGTSLGDMPLGFLSLYFDEEIGLYCAGARYYSPKLGRWINRCAQQPQGNPYRFRDNQPQIPHTALAQ